MGKSTSTAKRKYNKEAYTRHEFSIRKDTKLAYLLKDYKKENSLSDLIKDLLAEHFKVFANELYVSHRLEKIDNEWIEMVNTSIKTFDKNL